MSGWIAVVFVALGLVLMVRGERRSARILHDWAERRGYEVASVRRRWFWNGRFWWRASRAQRVYDATFVDKNGRHLHAQVRVGNWFLGALLDEVRVEWLDP